MKTFKKILNFIKMVPVILVQLIAGIVMLASILLFALATLIDSPKKFAFKAQVVKAAVQKIFRDIKLERLKNKYDYEKE